MWLVADDDDTRMHKMHRVKVTFLAWLKYIQKKRIRQQRRVIGMNDVLRGELVKMRLKIGSFSVGLVIALARIRLLSSVF